MLKSNEIWYIIITKTGGDAVYRPLADEIRPQSLDDVVGQEHIIGKNGLLRRIIESGKIPNMIFYGPSGVGKPPAELCTG